MTDVRAPVELPALAPADIRVRGLTKRFGDVVAVDAVGAGAGEVVLYATGSSARQTGLTDGRPVDAVIMAIVDEYDVGAGVVRT